MKYVSDSEIESGDEDSSLLGMDNELLTKFIKILNGSTDSIKTMVNKFYEELFFLFLIN